MKLFQTFAALSLVISSASYAGTISKKCLNELTETLNGSGSTDSVPVECQYSTFSDLPPNYQDRVQQELAKQGKSASGTNKLSTIVGSLKTKGQAPSTNSAQPAAATTEGGLAPYLQHYSQKDCPDYTGSPLQDCEKGSGQDCAIILDFAKRCADAGQCNDRFDQHGICGKKSAPKTSTTKKLSSGSSTTAPSAH